MQEQQQQQLKAMLGTSGQLAYYGLRLPQHQPNSSEVKNGLYGESRAPTAIPSIRPALFVPVQMYQQVQTSASPCNEADTSCSASPSTPVTTSCDITSAKNASSNVTSTEGNEENVSKEETKSNNARVQESSSGRKSPPPPSRMVTRSQTAACRTPAASDVDENVHQNLRSRPPKRSRTYIDEHDGGISPRKHREYHSSGGIGMDDLAFGKNPAGSGIEFGAVCGDCGVVAVTGAGLNAHQTAHRGDSTSCSYCTQSFLTPHGKDIHQQLHREGQTRDVDDYCECGICGGSFIAIIYLELHLLELHGRDALFDQRSIHLGPSNNSDTSCPPEDEGGRQLFRCGVCNMHFTYSLNLDCHMALHNEISYSCALCDATFTSLDPLVDHSKVHRYAGITPPTTTGIPIHVPPQIPIRRHPPPQRPVLTTPTPTSPLNIWGHNIIRNAQQPANIPAHTSAPIGMPINPAPISPITPAMLNYYMMMSLWGGDKSSSLDTPSFWPNYFNPAMSNLFNYFNPYLLNNNNNNISGANSTVTKVKEDKEENRNAEEENVVEGSGLREKSDTTSKYKDS